MQERYVLLWRDTELTVDREVCQCVRSQALYFYVLGLGEREQELQAAQLYNLLLSFSCRYTPGLVAYPANTTHTHQEREGSGIELWTFVVCVWVGVLYVRLTASLANVSATCCCNRSSEPCAYVMRRCR